MKKLLIALCAIGSLSACNKVLDINPDSQLDANTRFKELDDHRFSLLGTYSLFRSTSYYGAIDAAANAFVCLPDMLADDLLENKDENLGNERVFSNWLYLSSESQVEGVWLAAYKIISQANITLEGIDKFAEKEPKKVNRIKAQALAIRALVHFDILRYWVNDYNRNSTSPGIPYVTTFNYEAKPSRGTVAETYNKIEKDLLDAKALMQDLDQDINGFQERAYIDEMGVNAILARMYLYSNQMDKAIQFSTYVINAMPLTDKAVFDKIWTDAETGEVVWSVAFDNGQGTPGANVYAPDINRSQYTPNFNLVNAYSANDARLYAYFNVLSDNSGNHRLVLYKYYAKFSALNRPNGVVNFKAFRVGEMYLIRAEAYAKSGTPDEVKSMKDLNDLRAARISGYIPEILTGQPLLDAIEMERRKELFAEGHRFFDLKRKGVTERQVTRASTVLPPSSHRWNFPIPRPEIEANPNLRPQNDGYID